DAERMPPEGKPLTELEVERLSQWIKAGAHSPADEQADPSPRDHWAFQSPVRPLLPSLTIPAPNPIDHFISAKLAKHSMEPLPRADKRTLLRRVTMDLLGLPPTPAEMSAFLHDSTDDAYERAVDRLLASP